MTKNTNIVIIAPEINQVRIKRAKHMKKDTHPEYYKDAKISCACGADYVIGSTVKEVSVELCAKCHPFYTGKQKIIDTARRVEKFATRLSKKSEKVTSKAQKRAKRAKDKEDKKAKEDSA